MNVLSLFDGISCGQLSLRSCNIKVSNYYSSEIDNDAISVTKNNFNKTKFIGSVENINERLLKSLRIDIVIGGSPCQGFSSYGKQLNFNDSKSKLFFEYVRILNLLKKQNKDIIFFLENVSMKVEWEKIISNYMETFPLKINSNLVSSQNRKRLYWTNLPFQQIEDKNILLKDVLQSNVEKKYMFDDKLIKRFYANCNVDLSDKKCFAIKRDLLTRTNPKRQMGINENKMFTLPTTSPHGVFFNDKFRYCTPQEYEIFQTLPLNYTKILNDKKRYKCIGNGWTLEIINQFFKNI